jgi:hypothetical protein
MFAPFGLRALAVWVLALASLRFCEAAGPLPSWNDGASKRAILCFVEEVAARKHAMETGAIAFLRKPLTDELLTKLCTRRLGAPERQRSSRTR